MTPQGRALDAGRLHQAHKDNDARITADSAITTKVKTTFLTKGIPSTAISVETYEGIVQLSGFVDNAATKGRPVGGEQRSA